jgi:uncharacterized protein YuzE
MAQHRLTKNFVVTRDTRANAAYIYLTPIGPGDSARQIAVDLPRGTMILDLNSRGRLIGIEILNASAVLPESVLSHETNRQTSQQDRSRRAR